MADGEVSIEQVDSKDREKIEKKLKRIKTENPELYEDIIEAINSGKEIAGIVTAEVYVDELYREDGDDLICISSKLLNEDEVKKLDKSKLDKLIAIEPEVDSAYTIVRDYESKGQLTIDFMISFDDSYNNGNGIEYELDANANWDYFSWFYNSKYDPAVGEDFFGFGWGGGDFNYGSKSASADSNAGGSVSVNTAKVSPQSGYVWSFDELIVHSNPYYFFADHVDAEIDLYKNYLTGGGNTTSFVFEYIHTYQSNVGSVSIDASGLGFSLSSTDKSWSIVTEQSNSVFVY